MVGLVVFVGCDGGVCVGGVVFVGWLGVGVSGSPTSGFAVPKQFANTKPSFSPTFTYAHVFPSIVAFLVAVTSVPTSSSAVYAICCILV